MPVTRILIVAGSDSGGGAGIQADIKTVTLLGGHAMTAITAITAQNTLGVTDVHAIPADSVIAQIDAVASDIGVDAVKIGMIGSPDTAARVADRLCRPDLAGVPVVFDPVMIATSGSRLASAETIAVFGDLMRRATLSTPNLDELGALAGLTLSDEASVASAASGLIDRLGGGAILATGAELGAGELSDLLFEGSATEASCRWSAPCWRASAPVPYRSRRNRHRPSNRCA
ncbi:MAG: hydroxymethylpyrimidine/phosphomethylpyrimidine kinase [Rhizorhabdus sp.]|uniref:bifunctional hydroxymethylpyrimidine kinase/phosphomethylpyrimidine kinase n=2 Tax=Rhizorhabdus sp. TaxID=1968843 RepID=UPI001B67F10B|nr:bifunctional hydroxymethylpyrimidine kinase/phosphomethylpyrimidine kinase [Rhizorhabdus sp.]MBP8234898.1 hydroxymethylpyrimidine/phosphomethylpyrimidine kinase [Rhizorhabdus sp.]